MALRWSITLSLVLALFTGCIQRSPAALASLQVEGNLWSAGAPAEIRVRAQTARQGQSISLTLLTPAAEAHTPQIQRGGDFFGLSGVQLLWLPPEQQETEIALAAAAGAQFLGLDFDWRKIEPEAGQFTWEDTDRVVALAGRYGLRLAPMLIYTPLWASSSAYAPLDYHHAPPVKLTDYREFVYQVVNRYKPPRAEGSIQDWIIWNEPNVRSANQPPRPGNFWTGSLEGYIQLLRAGYEGAHAADPACNVLNGALADIFWAEGDADLLTALERFYDPNRDGDAGDGGRPFFDTLNIHIYPPNGEQSWYRARLEAVIALMKRFGDEQKTIWITETGFGSVISPTDTSPYVSEETQASRVRQVYETAAMYPQVEKVFWWSLREYYHDTTEFNTSMEAHYGLLRANFAPKPAYLAYARLTGSLAQVITLTAAAGADGAAQVTFPAEAITQAGNYVLFATLEPSSTTLVSETIVKVYSVIP